MDHGNVQIIENDEEFDAIIMSAEDKLVAVDFTAEWYAKNSFNSC